MAGYTQLMVDPPWPQRKGGRRGVRPRQGRALGYATLSLEGIEAVLRTEVLPQAAASHTLWLWAVERFLPEAEALLRRLGYRLHARLIWDKGNGVAPAFTVRFSHEYLLWAYRPRLQPVAADQRGKATTVLREAAREHSRKPDAAYRLVEQLYPQGRYLDVFSREARPGWAQWGDQCSYFGASARTAPAVH